MADIFLSYSRHDKERIAPLVKALEAQGWTVWWDQQIPPGKTFDQVIEAAIKAARCMLVVWSENSVGSRWVKTEAEEGAKRDRLVPVLIDDVEMPLAHRLLQASWLVGWDGISPHPQLNILIERVRELVSADGRERPQEIVDHPKQPREPQVGAIGPPGGASWNIENLYTPGRLVVTLVILVAVAILGWQAIAEKRARDQALKAAADHPSENIGEDPKIFTNWNEDQVFSHPTNPTEFSIAQPTYIANIYNYHYDWNGGYPAGKGMKLRDSHGQEFGPWEVSAGSSAGQKANVDWVCSPQIVLPAGIYTVIDPHPATWSQNAKSDHRGMSLVTGHVAKAN